MKRTMTAMTGRPVRIAGIYLELSVVAMRLPEKKKNRKITKKTLIVTIPGVHYG